MNMPANTSLFIEQSIDICAMDAPMRIYYIISCKLTDILYVLRYFTWTVFLPFPTLLPCSAFELFSNECPPFGTILVDKVQYFIVLFLCPWPLHQIRIENLLPSMLTLYITTVGEVTSESHPIYRSSLTLDQSLQFIILKSHK